ncbi:MAG: VWA domain-containing protein [Flavobacteriales bacterium]|nr:VWA domain-containing protein [Flavobacteriales bacterium]
MRRHALEVPFAPNAIPDIRKKLMATRCLGTTPIARSLEKAAKDFPELDKSKGARPVRNIIILITDGIEACDEDPCAVSRALQAKGIVLKPFVIGVGLTEMDRFALQCVGNYYDASTPELFAHVLDVVVTQALNSTTAQISLMTADGKPTETDVAVTLYDQKTGQQRYHMEHTLTDRGLPDTLSIDPIFTYRITAHTVPPSVRENVTVRPGAYHHRCGCRHGHAGSAHGQRSGRCEPGKLHRAPQGRTGHLDGHGHGPQPTPARRLLRSGGPHAAAHADHRCAG